MTPPHVKNTVSQVDCYREKAEMTRGVALARKTGHSNIEVLARRRLEALEKQCPGPEIKETMTPQCNAETPTLISLDFPHWTKDERQLYLIDRDGDGKPSLNDEIVDTLNGAVVVDRIMGPSHLKLDKFEVDKWVGYLRSGHVRIGLPVVCLNYQEFLKNRKITFSHPTLDSPTTPKSQTPQRKPTENKLADQLLEPADRLLEPPEFRRMTQGAQIPNKVTGGAKVKNPNLQKGENLKK